ncbi:hypothetical protein FHG64_15550 [Antarcticibacterium flavum]|uniref:Outer membrane lipoprotein-sorting protein n=1 Tax=Antarcticibacterium flavum TaxID=2058175 RepID=A0A5B7X7T6_9FLAO|nr:MULTISPECIES: DUF6503 family protein [Antarcticibacterium]MCM4159760.1 hypothetical protein [Antarcticibacterium sp. W02-3]QCY70691.1 hypothetical protein FHG64_15550 [Antarcticibacterium flavum]
MKYFLMFLCLLLISCNQSSKENPGTSNLNSYELSLTEAKAFVHSIEEAHNKEDWDKEEIVSFDIQLLMGGEERLKARIYTFTNSSKIRVDKKDGSSLIFDGKRVFQSPAAAPVNGARFDMFTWQYFFAFPFKLSDKGTNWELKEKETMKDISFPKAKLTFDATTGDAPDDWYILYKEPKSNLLYAAAYIVTLNTKKEIAEEEPHAIVYHDYELFKNIPIATRWTFHHWNDTEGIGEQIGEAKIENIEFPTLKRNFFEAPDDSREIELN